MTTKTKARKPRVPRVPADAELGGYVDLDTEDVRLPDGTRLTNEVAEQIVDEVRAKTGRPSLGPAGTRSPSVSFRVPPALRERAELVADQEQITVSDLAREALEVRVSEVGAVGSGEETLQAVRRQLAAIEKLLAGLEKPRARKSRA